MPVDALVNELIALGTLDETTVADLRRMQSDAAEGRLDPDDEGYIRALHARLTNAPAPEPVEAEPVRLDGLTLAEWRDRALAAEADAANLRDQLATQGPAP
ncbi:MAG: hypothetical protein EOP19_01590 [Hyphomicrobiales bacterium]|nr:MAG: hypothetical protein EOP19_01590 [Hyphomicrobiales bacterium]